MSSNRDSWHKPPKRELFMKAILTALPILFVSISSFASPIICQNQSEYWHEDSLVLDLTTMTGEYFDNDSLIPLVCSTDRDVDAIACHEKDDKNSLRTRISSDGSAVAIYTKEQMVNFKCALPAPPPR